MKDGLLLGWFKRLMAARYRCDLAITRMVMRSRGEERFRLGGECCGCGACCETPMIRTNVFFFHLRSVRWCILTWHRVVNGWEYIGEDRAARTFIFRCRHWDPDNGRCDSYAARPGMCRDYPRNLLYDPNPSFLDSCTHCAIDKDAAGFREALADFDLTPEERERLERRLHIHE